MSDTVSDTVSDGKASLSNIKVVVSDADSKFNSEFNKSLEFLERLSNEKKQKEDIVRNLEGHRTNDVIKGDKMNKRMNKRLRKKIQRESHHNKTIKNASTYKHENVYLDLPEEMHEPHLLVNTNMHVTNVTPFIAKTDRISNIGVGVSTEIVQDLPYGILKNGNKPTFRQWKKQQTIKNIGSFKKPSIVINESHETPHNSQRKESLNQFKLEYQHKTKQDKPGDDKPGDNKPGDDKPGDDKSVEDKPGDNKPGDDKPGDNKPLVRHTKRTTIRYDLGKKNRKIGILIKNRETRKNTQNKLAKIKKTNISQIKTMLRDKNIIKIGCLAPPDVLRKIYEETIKCGDIENMSSTALMHNYMNDS